MARARNLKPGFFKNETLAECSPLARILFAGLWCLADRAGRLEDRPKRIRAEILPYDDGSVDDMLEELHRAGFILRYEVDGQRFIQVVNFNKHQTPHHREPESTIPANSLPAFVSGDAQDKPGTSLGLAQDLPKSSRADSLNLIPLTLNPPSEVPSSTGASAPPGNSDSAMPVTATETADERHAGQVHRVGADCMPEPDPIFGGCLAFLTGKGCAAKGARSFLGLMRKNHGDAALVQAIERAEREDITDPIPWVKKYLESRTNAVGTGGEIGGISRRIFA